MKTQCFFDSSNLPYLTIVTAIRRVGTKPLMKNSWQCFNFLVLTKITLKCWKRRILITQRIQTPWLKFLDRDIYDRHRPWFAILILTTFTMCRVGFDNISNIPLQVPISWNILKLLFCRQNETSWTASGIASLNKITRKTLTFVL